MTTTTVYRPTEVETYQCSSCDHVQTTPDSVTFYDLDDYEFDGPIRYDDVERYFRDRVPEFQGYECSNCEAPTDAESVEEGSRWSCGYCGDLHVTPHSALLCCAECDQTGDDACLAFGYWWSPSEQIWACTCDSSCMFYVCAVCHYTFDDVTDAAEHVGSEHSDCDESDDEEVEDVQNVGGPQSLPPAMEYEEEERCQVCSSSFCCETHNVHRSPHRGCRNGSR